MNYKLNHNLIGLIPIILILMVLSLTCGCLGFFEGYTEKAQEYTSADYSIDNYKFFIDKYNAIRSIGAQIQIQDENIKEFNRLHPNPDTWTRTVENNYADLTYIKNGYTAQYNGFVSDYNARMRDLTTNQKWMKPQNYPAELQLYAPGNYITRENPSLDNL